MMVLGAAAPWFPEMGYEWSAFRVLGAALLSMAVVLALTPLLIRLGSRRGAGQQVREEGPASHQIKAGTPTLGGIAIVLGMLASLVLFKGFEPQVELPALGLMIACGLLGLADDAKKLITRRNLGLKARWKFLCQLLLGGGLIWWLQHSGVGMDLVLPWGGTLVVPEHSATEWLVMALILCVVVGSVNAVNLTDGLDGLAGGAAAAALAAYALIAWHTDHPGLAVLCAGGAGACLGFLWFNCHPARIFMGDTGSLALGGLLAAAAVVTGTELYLLIIGGVFVLEALSVMLQVAWFKATKGRRIFRMTPLHHHFELGGVPETRVTARFVLAGMALGAVGVWLFWLQPS